MSVAATKVSNFDHDPLSLRWLGEKIDNFAEAVVDTVQESLLLLDEDLRVRFSNRSFFLSFQVTPEETIDRLVFELGNGQWNIAELRRLLLEVLPENSSFRDFEVTHTFPHLGQKVMCLSAGKLRRQDDQSNLILLVIADITERKRVGEELLKREQKLSELIEEKELLVAELHHRVKNNLQTIISLLSLHSIHTSDPQVIQALLEAEGRVQAIARLHERLYASSNLSEINFSEYLHYLIDDLNTLYGRAEISFEIDSHDVLLSLETAVPLGLMANELIVNSLKHAFPLRRAGHVKVALGYVDDNVLQGVLVDVPIRLSVQDDGVGFGPGILPEATPTLGFKILRLLSNQLHGQVVFQSIDGVQACFNFVPDCVQKYKPYEKSTCSHIENENL